MKNNFIKLTSSTYDLIYHINSIMICGIIENEGNPIVKTMDGEEYQVKETPEEIIKLINKTDYYKI